MTEIQDKVALGLQVAERLWVPCLHCIDKKSEFWGVCPKCCGINKVFPLREPCGPGYDHTQCMRCHGLNWTVNTDYDELLEAVRAKGWYIDIISAWYDSGDIILVGAEPEDPSLAELDGSEGLRGTEALLTALVRALDKVGEI